MKYLIDIPEPKNCGNCSLSQSINYYGSVFCSLNRRVIKDDEFEEMPHWCPLEEVEE